MDTTYTPTIAHNTKTLDICNELVEAVLAGARSFKLGRFTARWEVEGESAWAIHDGCETRLLVYGLVVAIPTIVRCWLADNWDLDN